MFIKRVVLVVLDSVGVGALPDAVIYGDEGSHTLANCAYFVKGLFLPHLACLGLGNIAFISGVPLVFQPAGAYGKMAEKSSGKDTTTGHWEIAGLILDKPFPVYPGGFPPEIIEPFQDLIGRPILGNKAASGTEIIAGLGEKHLQTGYPIVYTSADSVFQIAAHEEIIPAEKLYFWCQAARNLLQGKHGVGRVIARPFTGPPGSFYRTTRRRDFSLPPSGPTILDGLKNSGLAVFAVGKIKDIFAGQGITHSVTTQNNQEGIDKTLAFLDKKEKGLIFTNLIDFDMLYGHRNDPYGYAKALEEFDTRLPEIIEVLQPDDILILTADHGCDPTTPSTDHSREYVPLLVYGKKVKAGVNLGVRDTFADVAATIADIFNLSSPRGKSFAPEIFH
ncbi:phosphopentomutase [Peptococcaceae bacterium SCADC1_2_3]|nr:phosphopentomutase [Peptococcaceae bacterium SCADC1_2_3]HBQ28281.1 phosphopentomutase [Desulfotomaculum sp.]HCJ79263.1 phosphopentomutase [Desulfotomaculum sp.]